MTKDEKKYGSRKNPRSFLTAEAACAFCVKESRALWIRLPLYPRGKFHIYPGGRKEFWPDPCTYSERNP